MLLLNLLTPLTRLLPGWPWRIILMNMLVGAAVILPFFVAALWWLSWQAAARSIAGTTAEAGGIDR